MRYPVFIWVPVAPEGGACFFLMNETRKGCIEAFNNWNPKEGWLKARKRGWKCQKMAVWPAEKEVEK